MLKTYKYRLYPTIKQKEVLEKTLNICCWLYNSALQERIGVYKKFNKSINCYHQIKELSECKKEVPELNSVFSQTLQDVLRRLNKSYQAFFRRIKKGEI